MGVILPTFDDRTPPESRTAFRRLASEADTLREAHQKLADLLAKQGKPLTLDDIQAALQSSGTNPLNVTGLIGAASASGIVRVGLHADRLALVLSSLKPGTVFLETDRHAIYALVSSTWTLILAVQFDTTANRPADLSTGDKGFLFQSTSGTGAGGVQRWSGTAWQYTGGVIVDTFANRPATANTLAGALFTASDRGFQVWRATGAAWVLLQGVGGPMRGTRVAADQRPAALTANDAGFIFEATDAGFQRYRWSGSAWVIQLNFGDPLSVTLSPDTKPSLGTDDANFRVWSTDFLRPYLWTGSAWQDDLNAPPRGLIAFFDTVQSAPWQLCNGSTVTGSQADGTTASVTVPDMTTGDPYLKGTAAGPAGGTTNVGAGAVPFVWKSEYVYYRL